MKFLDRIFEKNKIRETKKAFNKETFKKGTINCEYMPEGGRGLDVYEEKMMFKRDELEDKDVLDLGAGPELKLANELEKAGINSRVTSLSPDFADKEKIEKIRQHIRGTEVASIGQTLPFKNESFDKIFALNVAEHVEQEQLISIISEMARTLKEGGKATIGPNLHERYKIYDCILKDEELMNNLNKWNVNIEKAIIPEEIMKPVYIKNEYGYKGYEPYFNIVLTKNINNS